jgi:hypothetical protein
MLTGEGVWSAAAASPGLAAEVLAPVGQIDVAADTGSIARLTPTPRLNVARSTHATKPLETRRQAKTAHG